MKSVCFSVFFSAFVVCGFFLPVFAQDAEEMEEIVIEAEREDESAAEIKDESAFVTIIDSEEIKEVYTSVSETLEKTVGFTVKRLGGLGSFSTASIRGSSAEQVAVFIDGVPLNTGKSGVVNLSNIPVKGIERIEVYRGSVPLRFRTSAIGGAINIVMKEVQNELFHQFSGSYGSFGTYQINGTSTGTLKKVGYMVSATLSGTDGDFEFLDDNATPLNPDDDEFTTRKNNSFESKSVDAKLSFDLAPSFNMEISDSYFDKFEGVPGKGSFQSENASLDTLRNILTLGLKKEGFFSESIDAEARAYTKYERTNFKDIDGEIGIGNQDNANTTRAWGIDSYLSFYIGLNQILSAVLSYQTERFDSYDSLAAVPEGDTQRRHTYRAGIEDEIYLFGADMVLTPQALYTFVDNDFGGTLPFFGGSVLSIPEADDGGFLNLKTGVKYSLTQKLLLKANIGRFSRYPNFSELFGDRGGIIGNPELLPEKGLNWDVGVAYEKKDFSHKKPALEKIYLEGALFSSVYDELILFEQTSQFTFKAQNVSSAVIYGVETSWAFDFLQHLGLSGNYTYQYTENTSDIPFYRGNRLQLRPAHELFNKIEVKNNWANLFWEYSYLAQNYLDRANFFEVENRSVHNIGLKVFPNKSTTLTFEVKNLGDERVADVRGYPLPGRSFVGTAVFEF
jgi:iron complex outermembrane receptor protein